MSPARKCCIALAWRACRQRRELVGATDEEERTADAAKQAVHRRRRIEREDEGDDGGPGTYPEAPQPER